MFWLRCPRRHPCRACRALRPLQSGATARSGDRTAFHARSRAWIRRGHESLPIRAFESPATACLAPYHGIGGFDGVDRLWTPSLVPDLERDIRLPRRAIVPRFVRLICSRRLLRTGRLSPPSIHRLFPDRFATELLAPEVGEVQFSELQVRGVASVDVVIPAPATRTKVFVTLRPFHCVVLPTIRGARHRETRPGR